MSHKEGTMQRAVARAYQRLQGNHPRRPPAPFARTMEVLCDGLLGLAVVAFLGGVGLIVWGLVAGFAPIRLIAGLVLLAVSAVLLLLWERFAWEPFIKQFSQL